MLKEQYKILLVIASSIVILVITGFLFKRTEYFLFRELAYSEIPKEIYNTELPFLFKKKHIFNLPIGLIFASISIFTFTLFQIIVNSKFKTVIKLRSKPLKKYAKFYYDFGFNLTIMNGRLQDKNSYQDSFKIPLNEWESYRQNRQTKEHIMSFNWDDATGIGAITGINDLVCLDIDGCKDINFIEGFLNSLGLSKDYNWVVRSGSHTGFHIWIKTSTNFPGSIPYPPNNTLFYFPRKKFRILFKQIELRISDHVVLPPSINRNGNDYKFINNVPSNPPNEVDIINLIQNIEKVAICKNDYEYQVLKERQIMSILFIYLESSTNFYEMNFCSTNQYGGNATKISNTINVESPAQLIEHPKIVEIFRAINQADLVVLFEAGNVIKDIIKHLRAKDLLFYNKPVFQLNEFIKPHYVNGFNNLDDLYLTLFPFDNLEARENKNNIDIFIISFFRLADYFQDLRFKFKQYLNLDFEYFNVQIQNINEEKLSAIVLAIQREFIVSFTTSKDTILTTNREPKVRTILPLETSENSDGQSIINGFCFFESKINSYNLDDIRDLIVNPQFIDYTI